MKKRYSDQEMRQIMKRDLEIPEVVENKIEDAYSQIDALGGTKMRKYKKHRQLVILAAVLVVLCVGTLAGFAANGYFQKTVEKEADKLSYHFEINYDLTPYDIEVSPGYLPDGYELKEPDSPYGGKVHNDETGKGITMLPYNLASLDEMSSNDLLQFKDVTNVEELTIQNMDADLITTNNEIYGEGKSLFLFNEKDGYVVQVWTDGGITDDDLKKVAETMEIKKLDTQVAYKTEEEKKTEEEQMQAQMEKDRAFVEKGVTKESIHKIGEEVHNPWVEKLTDEPNMFGETLDSFGDIRYTVEDVQVLDALPLSEYPAEFYEDYENQIAPLLNEDGTLKPYERVKRTFSVDGSGDEEEIIETVNSKFVVVKMRLRNMRDVPTRFEWDIAPILTHLTAREDGGFDYPEYDFTPVDYDTNQIHGRFTSNGIHACYFDAPYFTEGIERLKDFTFVPIEANQELEYTVIYLADEDQLENMLLQFYYGYSDENNTPVQCYVKIS